MSKNEVIGTCSCPLCQFPDQEIRVSTNGKPYMVCEECGMQLFSRQARSVKLLKERIGAKPVDPVAPKPATPIPVPKPAAPAAAKPAPVPVPEPKPAAEKTIFDIFN